MELCDSMFGVKGQVVITGVGEFAAHKVLHMKKAWYSSHGSKIMTELGLCAPSRIASTRVDRDFLIV